MARFLFTVLGSNVGDFVDELQSRGMQFEEGERVYTDRELQREVNAAYAQWEATHREEIQRYKADRDEARADVAAAYERLRKG